MAWFAKMYDFFSKVVFILLEITIDFHFQNPSKTKSFYLYVIEKNSQQIYRSYSAYTYFSLNFLN